PQRSTPRPDHRAKDQTVEIRNSKRKLVLFHVHPFRGEIGSDYHLRLSAKPQAMIGRAKHVILFSFFCFLFFVIYFLYSGILARASDSEGESIFDPLRIQRIMIPTDRASAELERVKQGTLVQMSRKDFEELAERATQRLDALKNPPQLIES